MRHRATEYHDPSSIHATQSAVLIGLEGFEGTCVDFRDITGRMELAVETDHGAESQRLRTGSGPNRVKDIARTVSLRVIVR